ncbi:MAG: hypothetical protein AN484_26880 [Aphanizomenon flos-aquae WA102]|uniref:Integrase catalytic domain-containing protein n=1 Tax=Aphanizomenon flos-aquae WA102 TaxID=1710896 RepID=A0A1B7WAF6_APHFL|nr:MAG: hypothetical protein AN484_26880 [Aphanizomenon flos-aquae WA102]
MCKQIAKLCGGQIMAPTPPHRIGPAPPFYSTAIDLFGPYEYRDTVNKRKTAKAWGVMFVDTATSAVHVELAESYSCDSFMAAMRNFMNTHGAPSRIQSDRGDQLVAAAEQISQWDWDAMEQECSKDGVKWELVPVGAQHYNGQAERMIGLLKLILNQVLKDKRCSYGELQCILKEAAYVVNSRPLGKSTEDPAGEIIYRTA